MELLAVKALTGGGSAQGVNVGTVTNGSSFPTTRLDGSPLQNEDYVRPLASSTFPFTIGSCVFINRLSKAFYTNGNWYIDAGAIQDTSETPVKNPTTESIGGTSLNQSAINIENKTAINNKVEKSNINNKRLAYTRIAGVEGTLEIATTETTNTIAQRGTGGRLKVGDAVESNEAISKQQMENNLSYVHTQSTPATEWEIIHNLNRYLSIRIVDNTGNEIIGGVVYPNSNEIRVSFANAESGKAFLS